MLLCGLMTRNVYKKLNNSLSSVLKLSGGPNRWSNVYVITGWKVRVLQKTVNDIGKFENCTFES